MQNRPQVLTEKDERIISLATKLEPQEIAESLGMNTRDVLSVLNKPAAQTLINQEINRLNNDLIMSRLKKSKGLLEDILAKVGDIVDLGPKAWKMQHIKLFEMLLKEIPEQINKISQLNVQFNNYQKSPEETAVDDSIEKKMEMLPAEMKMQFWAKVEEMAEEYIRIYNAKKIQQSEGDISSESK